ncbi:olfactory receptor 4E1-like [Salminus brasiliensis]|uniref:olfactory receptor 4E1-like n=1 Tax=Salminus brasiliensis TaxID=930266 RepID=UPI003B8385C8
MMDNSSGEFMFVLHGLNDTRTNRHIYFAFGLLIYIFTLFVNVTLVITIVLDKMLHEPMYLFICSLYINGICGATSFYPKILADLLSDTHFISYTGCLAQTFTIYWYCFCEFLCLTVMAYDRYAAICKPLEYNSIMTHQKVVKLLLFTWILSLLESSFGAVLTVRLPLCGKDIDKIYCSNWEIVKLACTSVIVNNVYGYVLMFSHVSQAVFIIVSYIRIIRASMQSKTQRTKFMQTCLPHLITLTNFTLSIIFDVLYARYGKSQELQAVRNILGMEFLVVPPILNPIIYGIKITQIRHRFMQMCSNMRKAVKYN